MLLNNDYTECKIGTVMCLREEKGATNEKVIGPCNMQKE